MSVDALHEESYLDIETVRTIAVYEALRSTKTLCDQHAAPFVNIVAIMFHDLMRILTGLVLRQVEVSGPYAPDLDALPVSPVGCPFVGYREILAGINPDSKRFGAMAERRAIRRRLQLAKRSMRSTLRSIRDAFASDGPLIWTDPIAISAQSMGLSGLRFDEKVPKRFPVPNLAAQVAVLDDQICGLLSRLGLERFSAGICCLVERQIHAYAHEGEMHPPAADAVLFGTPFYVPYRFMQASARHFGREVFGVMHGEADAYDEPWVAYGERGFSTTVIGYGPASANVGGRFRDGLFGATSYATSNSNVVLRTFRHGEGVSPLADLEQMKLLYVPSQLYGQRRYGPFMLAPDKLYISWQEALFREIPGLVFKRHPKEFAAERLPAGANRTAEGHLRDYLDDFDGFVFDIISGAAFEAAATNKPVIYFDIGLRNLTDVAERLVNERFIRIKVDPEHPVALRERVEEYVGTERTNALTETLTLNGGEDSTPRGQTTIGLLRAIKQPQ